MARPLVLVMGPGLVLELVLVLAMVPGPGTSYGYVAHGHRTCQLYCDDTPRALPTHTPPLPTSNWTN